MLASDFTSGTGDVLYWVALVVLLLDQPAGPALVSAAVVVRLLPRVLFGAFAGVIADRFDRRRLMLALDGSRAVLMLLLAFVAFGSGSPVAVLVIVFASCAISTPYRPAMSAAIPDLVGEPALAGANALDMTAGQVATFSGPLLAAVVLAVADPAWAFVANGATFIVSFTLLSFATGLRSISTPLEGRRESILGALRVGANAVRRQPGVAVLTCSAAAVMLLRGLEMVLHVQVATELLDLGPAGYGLMSGALGAGALVAAPFTGAIADSTRPGRILVATVVASAASVGVLAAVRQPVVAMVVLAFAGAAAVGFEVIALTTLQRICGTNVLGRVLGIQNTINGGAKLTGSILAAVLVAAIGLPMALTVPSVVVVAAVALMAPSLLSLGARAAARRDEVAPFVDVFRRLGLFRGASSPALERLAKRIEVRAVEAGEIVVAEGDPADAFFVIDRGSFTVRRGTTEVVRLGAEDWFGEVGLLRNQPRNASVLAATDGVVWKMSGDAFIDAVTSSPSIPEPLVESMSRRLPSSPSPRHPDDVSI